MRDVADDAVVDGGGVPLFVGDELLWRLTLELRFVVGAGIIVFMG